MSIKTKFYNFKNNPTSRLLGLLNKHASIFSDRAYIKLKFLLQMKCFLHLRNPHTFNEKLNWLKLYDRNPLYTQLVDKYSVKAWVSEKVGAKYVIPTIGVWNRPEDIDWDCLPENFVLKTTHGGGNTGVIICKGKNSFDKVAACVKLNESLHSDLYLSSREWPYKNVAKRIIAEIYMEDIKTAELRDYKFFCFDGRVKAMFIGSERQRQKEPNFDFFDADFNHLIIKQGHPNSSKLPEKPSCFEEMKKVAETLSKGIPHVRVDLYEVNGAVYFGEMTFYHFGGFVPFVPKKWDNIFGDWLVLPNK